MGADMLALQMFDERIITTILGDDVKIAGRISRHGASNIIGECEIEGVSARRSEAHQLHRGGVLQEFFDQVCIELGLLRAQQQGEADGLVANNRRINLMHVFVIHENMIQPWWKVGSNGVHKYFGSEGMMELFVSVGKNVAHAIQNNFVVKIHKPLASGTWLAKLQMLCSLANPV